jgi:hypothetical protein
MSQGFDVATPSVLTKKSAWNIYTALLTIALVALILCMVFLYLEIREYGGFGAVKGASLRTAPASASVLGSTGFA